MRMLFSLLERVGPQDHTRVLRAIRDRRRELEQKDAFRIESSAFRPLTVQEQSVV